MYIMCNLGLFSFDRYVFKSAGRCAAVLTVSGSSDPFRVAVLKDRPGVHPNPLPNPVSVSLSVSVPLSGDLGTHRRCKYIRTCVHTFTRTCTLISCVCMYITCHVCNVMYRCVTQCEIIPCVMLLF